MNNKRWLDLELRKDPDDLVTLLYALESKHRIDVISIDSPSTLELSLLNKLKNHYNASFDVVITGEHTIYDSNLDVDPLIVDFFNLSTDDTLPFSFPIRDYIFISELHTPSDDCYIEFFGGGSLLTLSILLDKAPNKVIRAVVQGGFAGREFAGDENTLKKFKNRKGDAVPSWNMNLNLKASQKVVSALDVNVSFVSKNICHDSWVYFSDVTELTQKNLFVKFLKTFLSNIPNRKKCMHDLLAYMTLDSPSLVLSKPVELKHDDSDNVKWRSVESKATKHQISISFNKEHYISLIKKVGA